jgi:hypothetical protein
MSSIVIGYFRSPNHIPYSAPVEAIYFPATKQPVLHDPMQLPRDFVFLGQSKAKASRWISAK